MAGEAGVAGGSKRVAPIMSVRSRAPSTGKVADWRDEAAAPWAMRAAALVCERPCRCSSRRTSRSFSPLRMITCRWECSSVGGSGEGMLKEYSEGTVGTWHVALASAHDHLRRGGRMLRGCSMLTSPPKSNSPWLPASSTSATA